MTAGLTDSYAGSHLGSDSLASGPNKVRKKNKKIKKGEAIMLVKKHLVPSQSSAYSKNSTWSNPQAPAPSTKKQKASMVIPKSKNVAVKKKTKVSKNTRPPNTEQLLKQATRIAGDTKNLHLLQEAIIEFKTQRDEFVHSLNGLQKKLKEFQIPELFAPSTSSKTEKGEKERRSSNEKPKKPRDKEKDGEVDKTDDKGDRKPEKKTDKKKKRKDVRSVSQHFYLADMTESEDSSSTSSSSSESSSSEDKDEEEEKKLADKKVKDFLDTNLIPIQPPEKGRNLDRVNSLMKHGSPWGSKKSKSTVDGKLNLLKRTVMEASNKKIPVKTEASRQKSSFEATSCDPSRNAAVQAEFKKLQKASENRMRQKLRNT